MRQAIRQRGVGVDTHFVARAEIDPAKRNLNKIINNMNKEERKKLDESIGKAFCKRAKAAKSGLDSEILSTNSESWWKDYINHAGRVNRNKSTTTGTVDLCFVVKPVVNDINEVVKGFLIAAEGKERDTAAKKIIKTVEVAAEQASKNDVITARLVDHQGKLTSTV